MQKACCIGTTPAVWMLIGGGIGDMLKVTVESESMHFTEVGASVEGWIGG